MKKYNIDGEYNHYEIAPDELESFIVSLAEQNLSGVNITIPHKEQMLKYVDMCDESADFIQAINTVVVDKDGKRIGINTDVYGFVTNLQENAQDFNFKESKALVLGAGGAARAIIAGLLGDLNVSVIILLNRTREKAEDLKQSFIHSVNNMLVKSGDEEDIKKKAEAFVSRIQIIDWEYLNDIIKDVNLVVNTTSLGMIGQPELKIDLSTLPKKSLVTDIVFNPLETDLLRQARVGGYQTIDGLGMLLHQAAPGFKYWFDPDDKAIESLPVVDDELRNYVLKGLNN